MIGSGVLLPVPHGMCVWEGWRESGGGVTLLLSWPDVCPADVSPSYSHYYSNPSYHTLSQCSPNPPPPNKVSALGGGVFWVWVKASTLYSP